MVVLVDLLATIREPQAAVEQVQQEVILLELLLVVLEEQVLIQHLVTHQQLQLA
jgi:hypothetical protein